MKNLIDVVSSGTEIEMYQCLRENLAREIDLSESGRDIAALSKQFVEVTERIRELEKLIPKERNTPLDKVKKKNKSPSKR